VWLYLADAPQFGRLFFFRSMEQYAPTTRTRADGTFTLGRLPQGCTASIKIKHAETGTGDMWYAKDLERDRKVDDVKLPAGITLEGSVRFASTGLPAAGAKVVLGRYHEDTDPVTTTTLGGRFRFVGLEQHHFTDEYTTVRATAEEGDGGVPKWEGEARLAARLYPGDSLNGVEVTLERSFASVQAEWKKKKAAPAESRYRVAVLDDADPAFSGKAKFDDTLTLHDSGGKPLWQYKGLNVAQTVGGNHAIAFGAKDRSLWVAESVGGRLLHFNADTGKVNWEKPGVKGHAVAVDPRTGNGWVLTAEGTIYGKDLLVFSPAGEQIAQHKINGFDIAYSPHDDCFWLAGQRLVKVDRDGKVLFQSAEPFAWVATSVSVNERDGTVWVMEGLHPQVPGSTGRVIVCAPDGKRMAEFPTEGGGVAVDSQRDTTWATGRSLYRLGPDAKPTGSSPLRGFTLAVEPDTGYAWVASNEGVFRIDPGGKLAWEQLTKDGSQKWVCAVPPSDTGK
jgi:sugar lactone lactonase YvrE